MIPQYFIFYSWQSDNKKVQDIIQQALNEVVNQFRGNGIAVALEQGKGQAICKLQKLRY